MKLVAGAWDANGISRRDADGTHMGRCVGVPPPRHITPWGLDAASTSARARHTPGRKRGRTPEVRLLSCVAHRRPASVRPALATGSSCPPPDSATRAWTAGSSGSTRKSMCTPSRPSAIPSMGASAKVTFDGPEAWPVYVRPLISVVWFVPGATSMGLPLRPIGVRAGSSPEAAEGARSAFGSSGAFGVHHLRPVSQPYRPAGSQAAGLKRGARQGMTAPRRQMPSSAARPRNRCR